MNFSSFRENLINAVTVLAVALIFSQAGFGQKALEIHRPAPTTLKKTEASLPKVTAIDIEGLRELIKPKGNPLIINFWATWCDPCREEFPDLGQD